jgi:hypothetical protein
LSFDFKMYEIPQSLVSLGGLFFLFFQPLEPH